MTVSKTRSLVECSLMIAIATVLSMLPIYEMPMGGTITLCGTAPVIIASYRHGLRWGLGAGVTFGLMQLLFDLKTLSYCATALAVAGCILLDYLMAFTVLGTACLFAKPFRSPITGAAAGAAAVSFLRFLCSFLSGVIIWGDYAPEGTPVWLYSLLYNGGYIFVDACITIGAVAALSRVLARGGAAKAA